MKDKNLKGCLQQSLGEEKRNTEETPALPHWRRYHPVAAGHDCGKDLSVPSNEYFGKSLQENRIDWKAHNEKVLERLLSKS